MLGPVSGGPSASNKPAAKTPTFFFDIEASLLPSAEDLKTKLFPTVWAVSADDKEVVIQSRGAFPYPVSKETLAGLTFGIPLGKAMQQGGTPPGSPPGSIAGPGGFPPQQGRPPAAAQPGRGGRTAGGGANLSDQ